MLSVSVFILDNAAAASSNAQDTDEERRFKTSGSANAFPSGVDNLPIPESSIFNHLVSLPPLKEIFS